MYKFEDIFRLLDKDDDLYENPAIFKSLYESDVLRGYYREALNLKFAASHFPVLQLDKSIKDDLFNKLGIARSVQPVQDKDKNKKKSLFFLPYILTSLLSVILTIIFMSNLERQNNTENNQIPVNNNYVENVNQSLISSNTAKTSNHKKNQVKANSNVNDLNKSVELETVIKNKDRILNKTIDNNLISKENKLLISDNSLISENSNKLEFPITQINTKSIDNINIMELKNTENTKSGFALKFSIFTDRHQIEPAIAPAKWADFNNIIIGIEYSITSFINLGLEYRRENFYQIYQGRESGALFEYEQQPNLESFETSLKFTPVRIHFAEPYINIKSGINIGGYVVRSGIGTSIFISDYFGFDIGFEYSQFNYHHQNNSYQSEKASFLIGLIYNF
jgi:hypothetical protein